MHLDFNFKITALFIDRWMSAKFAWVWQWLSMGEHNQYMLTLVDKSNKNWDAIKSLDVHVWMEAVYCGAWHHDFYSFFIGRRLWWLRCRVLLGAPFFSILFFMLFFVRLLRKKWLLQNLSYVFFFKILVTN